MKRSLLQLQKSLKPSLLVLLALLLTACSTIYLDAKGNPLPENVIEARVLSPRILVTYSFLHFYGKQEGQEILDTWRFLPFVGVKGYNQVDKNSLAGLVLKVEIFNPEKKEFWISYSIYVNAEKMEGKKFQYFPAYHGQLSRKSLEIKLPIDEPGEVTAKFYIHDKGGGLAFESFEAKYKIN